MQMRYEPHPTKTLNLPSNRSIKRNSWDSCEDCKGFRASLQDPCYLNLLSRPQGGATSQRKTKLQLIRLSAAVCGIELCYAAETAFVSPILLKLGVPVSLMTMIWCLSPVLGFFLVPVMGSLSDRCPLAIGRRRPFILAMTVGIVIGLALVPNGEALGKVCGVRYVRSGVGSSVGRVT